MAIFESDRPKISRLIVTGANGGIGTAIRGQLDHLADEVILSDLVDVEVSGNEKSHPCDLTDFDAVCRLLEGGGDLLHFGGQSLEAPFQTILEANLVGTYNLYEAARLEGVRRILFASSNHAIGFHRREDKLDARSPTLPDTLYGVSKVYGEAVAQLYFQKFGIESLLLRIGSCFPKPSDLRQLSTWLSYGDLLRLIERMIVTTDLGCPIVYGASNNREGWWDNSHVDYIGWKPQDNADDYRDELLAKFDTPDPNDPAVAFQGGGFVTLDHPGTEEQSS